jgi:type IV pilus assembly protein PilA
MIKHKQGFILIELMFVVAIIGILAAIALPAYNDYLVRAKVAEPLLALNEVKQAVNEFYRATGRFPKNNKEAGLAEAKHYRGLYFIAAQVENGAIHIQYDKTLDRLNKQTRWLTLRPVKDELNITDLNWACGKAGANKSLTLIGEDKTDLAPEYLPGNCR